MFEDTFQSFFHGIQSGNIAVISGPNHAEEIITGMASATVIASTNIAYAKDLQSLFSSDTFRVYTSQDVVGVQIGAAVKNIIAIASGLCVGLKLGDNTQAALVSRGMNEILNLKSTYNFDMKTVYGLSGLGDLIATCYSPHSRNRKLGILIAEGYTLQDANIKIGMVSEGVNACRILSHMSVDTPICDEVYRTLMKMRWQPSLKIIPHYESDPLYIDALVNSIKKKIKEINWKPDLILASYHGIPKKYFDKGDPYHCYCHKTTRLISEKFNSIEIKTTFQSRFGPQEWLQPYTDKTLENLPKEGKKNVLAICPGFSSDCVETLEEILIQGKESFVNSGGENFDMIPCLNDNDDHITLLKSLIQRSI